MDGRRYLLRMVRWVADLEDDNATSDEGEGEGERLARTYARTKKQIATHSSDDVSDLNKKLTRQHHHRR